jgi:hypothetical protein
MDDQREEALRNEAINLRLAGERRCDICCALRRSTAWFDKWWARYRRYGRAGLKSCSRAPKHVHNKMAPEIEEAIVRIRKVLEERTDPELKYAFIGAPTIRTALHRRKWTQPRRRRKHPNEPTAYCPLPVAQSPNDGHAMDIITRHLLGGERICSFHLLDLASHYPVLRQYPDKSAVSAKAFLVTTWQTVGLPKFLQMDNEATFCGGYRGQRVFSQIARKSGIWSWRTARLERPMLQLDCQSASDVLSVATAYIGPQTRLRCAVGSQLVSKHLWGDHSRLEQPFGLFNVSR